MPVLTLLSLIYRNSPKQLGMVSPELRRHDLLATASRLASRRGLAAAPRDPPGRAERRRQDRLVARGHRLFVRAGLGRWRTDRPQPCGPAEKGEQASRLDRWAGVPLAATTTAANVNEVTQLRGLVEAIPPVRGKSGRPSRPDRLYGDRGYDSEPERRWLRRRGIEPFLARRGTEHGSRLGIYRWVVERTLSWLHAKQKLRVRTDRRTDIHQAFLSLACSLICLIFL